MNRARPAEHDLFLSIGGVAGQLTLGAAPSTFLAQVRGRYGAFLLPAGPDVQRAFSLRLALQPAPAPVRMNDPQAAAHLARIEKHPLRVVATDSTIKITRWDLSVRLTAKKTRGRTQWTGTGRCTMNPYALDCLLRVIWSVILPREDGALIHSCGLRHGAVGVVFPGESGQGKSTLAGKAPDADDVLSDEMIALRRTDDGWRVYGTPFWGDFARGGISMRSWPLRCLAFLAQRDSVQMSPVTSSEAALRLLACMLCFQTDRATIARNLALAARLCSEVRSVEAQLTRTATTAEIFTRLIPHLGPDVHRQVPTYSTREMISEFRSFLRKHRVYSFSPKGSGLRPFVKSRDSLLIEAVSREDLDVGDIALYWTPGRTPDDDALSCQRVGAHAPSFDSSRQELLGRVSGLSHEGRTIPMPGRVDTFARLFGAQVAVPILRLAGR